MDVKETDFKEGEWAWYLYQRRRQGLCPKWQSNYVGPYLIVKKLSSYNFAIQKTKRSMPMVVHKDKLKKCLAETPKSWLAEEMDRPSDDENGRTRSVPTQYSQLDIDQLTNVQSHGAPAVPVQMASDTGQDDEAARRIDGRQTTPNSQESGVTMQTAPNNEPRPPTCVDHPNDVVMQFCDINDNCRPVRRKKKPHWSHDYVCRADLRRQPSDKENRSCPLGRIQIRKSGCCRHCPDSAPTLMS